MSHPSLIHYVNESYLDLVKRLEDPPVEESANVPDPEPGDISQLRIVVDADELFSHIEPQLESSDFFTMLVEGEQGSGKSTIARQLAHRAHSLGYKLIYKSGFDLMDSSDRIKAEAGGAKKVCIVLDDMSYVMSSTSSRSASKVKNLFGLIRHYLEGAQVMLIIIAHTFFAVPPIFRQSSVYVFSKPRPTELDYMIKLCGRNKKAKDQLERMFKSVCDIQAAAQKSKTIPLNLYGRSYQFIWGDKSNIGANDGRLSLLILNGEALVYNSESEFCEECKGIGFGVRVRDSDYSTKRPSDESSNKEDPTQ